MMSHIELRNQTGCSLHLCKQAIDYTTEHNGDDSVAVAFLKAKSFVLKTACDFDERVRYFMED